MIDQTFWSTKGEKKKGNENAQNIEKVQKSEMRKICLRLRAFELYE